MTFSGNWMVELQISPRSRLFAAFLRKQWAPSSFASLFGRLPCQRLPALERILAWWSLVFKSLRESTGGLGNDRVVVRMILMQGNMSQLIHIRSIPCCQIVVLREFLATVDAFCEYVFKHMSMPRIGMSVFLAIQVLIHVRDAQHGGMLQSKMGCWFLVLFKGRDCSMCCTLPENLDKNLPESYKQPSFPKNIPPHQSGWWLCLHVPPRQTQRCFRWMVVLSIPTALWDLHWWANWGVTWAIVWGGGLLVKDLLP